VSHSAGSLPSASRLGDRLSPSCRSATARPAYSEQSARRPRRTARTLPLHPIPVPHHVAKALEDTRVGHLSVVNHLRLFWLFPQLVPPVPTTSCGGRGGLSSPKLRASNIWICPVTIILMLGGRARPMASCLPYVATIRILCTPDADVIRRPNPKTASVTVDRRVHVAAAADTSINDVHTPSSNSLPRTTRPSRGLSIARNHRQQFELAHEKHGLAADDLERSGQLGLG
jgi:hypothetical protein